MRTILPTFFLVSIAACAAGSPPASDPTSETTTTSNTTTTTNANTKSTGPTNEAVRVAAAHVSLSSSPLFDWPVPAGWKKETLTFPLAFAPSIPYQGVEELRFAPKFFDAKSETYFTYSFAFVLDGETVTPFTADRFAEDLRTYFTGLMSAVGKKPADPDAHVVTVTSLDGTRFRGHVRTFDAFGANKGEKPARARVLDLGLEGETYLCGGRRVILTSLSPRPATDPVWDTLAKVRKSFRCLSE